MEKKYYTKKELLESKQLINEDTLETILMTIGFIPVIGEIADIILIIRYLRRKEYLYAGLMLIALIPTVGDFIAKPLIKLLKGPIGKGVLKNSDELVKFAKSNPEFAKQYIQLGKHVNSPVVNRSIKQIENIPGVGKNAAEGLRYSMSQHSNAISKLGSFFSRPVQMGKQIGATVSAGGTFSRGVKNFFQGEKLAAYVAKNGKKPSTWLANWWHVVMPARRSRRNMVKHFIFANGLLDLFGLPSFEAFEEKFNKDEKFREELANNPKFSQLVNQTTDPQDLSQIENMTSGVETQSSGMNPLEGQIGLNLLKRFAQSL